jgi:TonB-linked SusC/RagA family outer membrane protein
MKRFAVILGLLVFCCLAQVNAQTRQITGTVTSSEDGMPFPGVSVTVKGTTVGISTDLNGKYTLNVPTNATTLVFSFIGFKTKEVAITGNVIDAVIDPDTQELEEVVVVAYGTATKSSFTGSASTVKAEKLEKIQTSSVSKALEGVAAGVQVVSSSGQPGEDATIRIRGIGSINASSAPLYVVDGVPYGGNISAINPSDIENISILKDAAANSLYGSRAANGVIMITTKKGTKGASKVTFESRVGVNSRGVPEYDIIKDPGKYYELSWQALRNAYLYDPNNPVSAAIAAQQASDSLIKRLGYYNNYNLPNEQVVLPNGQLNPAAVLRYNDKWQDEMFSKSIRQEYQLQFSGGSEKTTHFISFGYLNDKGYVTRSDFQRFSTRANLDYQVYDWLKVGNSFAYSRESQNFPVSSGSAYVNMFMFTRNIPVIYPVYLRNTAGDYVLDANGDRVYDMGGNFIFDENGEKIVIGYDIDNNPIFAQYSRKYGANVNPVASTKLDIRENIYNVLSLRPYIEVRFLKDFKFTNNLSVDTRNYLGTEYQNPKYGSGASVQGRGDKYQTSYLVSTINQLLTWNKSFNQHGLEVLLGHEYFFTRYDFLNARKEKFFIPDIAELDNAVILSSASSYITETKQQSYFSRVSYNFDSKYFLSASYRRDGSSRFHPDHRWGDFWSVGGAWLVNKEDFMQGLAFINDLKLKASYGTNGNNALFYDDNATPVYFPYQNLYEVVNVNGEISIKPVYKGNKTVTWEKSKNLNIGIEGKLFGKLWVEFDYFNKYTDDLLFNEPLAPSSGFSYRPINIGNMVNKGFEGLLTYDIFNQKDLSWSVSLNFTHYSNEITKLPNYMNSNPEGGQPWAGDKILKEGGSLYDFYLENWVGIDPLTGKALYRDKNGVDTTYTGNLQRLVAGSAIPDLYGGISTSINYKGFDFSLGLSYQIGGLVYDASYQGLMSGLSELGGANLHVDALNSWTVDNPSSSIPLLQAGYQNGNNRSQRWLIDASYLNLRNITMGYTIPIKKILPTSPISSLRIYAVGDNVYLWSNRKGMDPRQSIAGNAGNRYSPIRTISGGLSLTF